MFFLGVKPALPTDSGVPGLSTNLFWGFDEDPHCFLVVISFCEFMRRDVELLLESLSESILTWVLYWFKRVSGDL